MHEICCLRVSTMVPFCPKSLWIVFNWLSHLKGRIESLCNENDINYRLCERHQHLKETHPKMRPVWRISFKIALFEFVELCTQMNTLKGHVCSQQLRHFAGRKLRGPLMLDKNSPFWDVTAVSLYPQLFFCIFCGLNCSTGHSFMFFFPCETARPCFGGALAKVSTQNILNNQLAE